MKIQSLLLLLALPISSFASSCPLTSVKAAKAVYEINFSKIKGKQRIENVVLPSEEDVVVRRIQFSTSDSSIAYLVTTYPDRCIVASVTLENIGG